MSRLFKGKFLYYLKQSYYGGKLKLNGAIKALESKQSFQKLLDILYKKEWIVYCKPPFRNAEFVIEYLGRYTHKIAISNNRICKLEDGNVTFKWRDYSDDNKNKLMTLSAFEFIRRFLLHVLPQRFVRIRHYGILSNRNRETKLRKCKKILKVPLNIKDKTKSKETWEEILFKITGIDHTICSICNKGKMIEKQTIKPQCCSPPKTNSLVANF